MKIVHHKGQKYYWEYIPFSSDGRWKDIKEYPGDERSVDLWVRTKKQKGEIGYRVTDCYFNNTEFLWKSHDASGGVVTIKSPVLYYMERPDPPAGENDFSIEYRKTSRTHRRKVFIND